MRFLPTLNEQSFKFAFSLLRHIICQSTTQLCVINRWLVIVKLRVQDLHLVRLYFLLAVTVLLARLALLANI